MPKHRRDRSVSNDSCRGSPFSCSSSKVRSRSSPKHVMESDENLKEWEDASCPVCMEHPHNAVLLLCSSHKKGCRPFMCDTSYRHSNCLDQFKKSFKDISVTEPLQPEPVMEMEPATPLVDEEINMGVEATADFLLWATQLGSHSTYMYSPDDPIPPCPLCRGKIFAKTVMEPARQLMNAKVRSCACETCDFIGSYSDLRKHARVAHPSARPTEADPERQRSWRRLERQRDIGDLLSTLQSSFGEEERDEESILPIDEGGWLTVFFLIRVFRPGSDSRSGSSWSGASRARAHSSVRRRLTRLWGESYDTENNTRSPRNDGNENSDGRSGGPWRRLTRRRTTPENQQNNTRAPGNDGDESSDGGSGGPWRRRTRRVTTPDNQQNITWPPINDGDESSDGGLVGPWRRRTRRRTTPDNQQ